MPCYRPKTVKMSNNGLQPLSMIFCFVCAFYFYFWRSFMAFTSNQRESYIVSEQIKLTNQPVDIKKALISISYISLICAQIDLSKILAIWRNTVRDHSILMVIGPMIHILFTGFPLFLCIFFWIFWLLVQQMCDDQIHIRIFGFIHFEMCFICQFNIKFASSLSSYVNSYWFLGEFWCCKNCKTDVMGVGFILEKCWNFCFTFSIWSVNCSTK